MRDSDGHSVRTMNNGPSREEFAAFTGRLYKTIDDGFAAINDRLDIVNGRTGKSEVEIGKLDIRLSSAEQKLFRRRQDEDSGTIQTKRTTRPGTGAAWAEERVTKREGALIGLGLTVLVTVLKVLEVLGTKLFHVLMANKP